MLMSLMPFKKMYITTGAIGILRPAGQLSLESIFVLPQVHVLLMGIQQAGVPLPSDAVEEPIFVNAKQYHGILRRRQSRAKAESENKAVKVRKVSVETKACSSVVDTL